MRRTHQLRRQYRPAAWAGLVLSVLFHAAVLAFARFDGVVLPSSQRAGAETTELDDVDAPTPPEVMRVVAIRPAPAEPARNAAGGGAISSSASATPTVAVAATPRPGGFELPASDEPTASTDRLAVVDPLRNVAVEPIAFVDLPVAETTPVEPAADERSAYVPGSIGKAKRKWADEEDGGTDLGRGIGWGIAVGGSGDHCPAPAGGRGPGRGPLWFAAH